MHEVRLKIRDASLLRFGLFWVFDVHSDTGMSWSRNMLLVGYRPIARSLLILSTTTNIWGGAQGNVVNLHLFPKWGWKLFAIYLEISSSCFYLRKKEILFFARPSVCSYLSLPVRSRRQDCSRKVKDGRFVSLIFFSIWGSSRLMFCCRTLNSRRATIACSCFGLIGNWLKRRAQFIYDRNYNRIGLQLRVMHLADSGEEVKTSVTQKEKSKGICIEGYPEKYHFLLFLHIHNESVQNQDAEVYCPWRLVSIV